jgi:Mrp family chromosome partitioning ATPase
MTTKTIGIIQVKCGAGRSTVSTNLAGELSKLGKKGYGVRGATEQPTHLRRFVKTFVL